MVLICESLKLSKRATCRYRLIQCEPKTIISVEVIHRTCRISLWFDLPILLKEVDDDGRKSSISDHLAGLLLGLAYIQYLYDNFQHVGGVLLNNVSTLINYSYIYDYRFFLIYKKMYVPLCKRNEFRLFYSVTN